jgi:hypothetical protein
MYCKGWKWSHLVLALTLGAVGSAGFAADGQWTLRKSGDGVEISSRPSAGSPINDIRSATRIKGSLDSVVGLMRDYAARPQWDAMCGEIKVLQMGPNSETVYVQSKLPWPVTDRDLVMHVEWKQDPATGVITEYAVGVPDAAPPHEGRVRMASFTNTWTFTPQDGGYVAVESIAHADPSGPMPTWMINQLSTDAPLDAMKKIRDIASQGYPPKGHTAFMTRH